MELRKDSLLAVVVVTLVLFTSCSPAPQDTGSGGEAGTEPEEDGVEAMFFEDFVADDSASRFERTILLRDEFVVAQDEWPGDHAITGPNDTCSAPEETRTVHRNQLSNGEWNYRCLPGGDPAKAHLMTSIGDTSGYALGAFTPTQTFTDIREVRWDVNITDLGARQWTEVGIIPSAEFSLDRIPCVIEWTACKTMTPFPQQLGAVSTSFQNQELHIHNGTNRDHSSQWGSAFLNPADPALDEIRTRRQHFFRDNGDGTLTFGIQQIDGSFYEYTRNGSFPTGNARVVFSDHNYQPNLSNPSTFTWHWDNITILD